MKSPEQFRVIVPHYPREAQVGNNGCYEMPSPIGSDLLLRVIASDGMGWDHVSVHCQMRCPSWEEMHYVKTLFWHDDEAVMQLHPPASEYVNNHPYCLHLWRPQDADIPRPPSWMVGLRGITPEEVQRMMKRGDQP